MYVSMYGNQVSISSRVFKTISANLSYFEMAKTDCSKTNVKMALKTPKWNLMEANQRGTDNRFANVITEVKPCDYF